MSKAEESPSLAETIKLKLNWYERIARAESCGKFTDEDLFLAASWVTCACGELDVKIPRYGGNTLAAYAPIDRNLYGLGVSFHVAVKCSNFLVARRILRDIQRRAIQVIDEERRKYELV